MCSENISDSLDGAEKSHTDKRAFGTICIGDIYIMGLLLNTRRLPSPYREWFIIVFVAGNRGD